MQYTHLWVIQNYFLSQADLKTSHPLPGLQL